MSENESTEVTETETPAPEGNGPKELREALKRANEEAAKYRSIVMKDVYGQAGLDPEKGLGKAIAKEYKGEPDVAALLEYAQTEYGYEAPSQPENPAQPQIQQGTRQAEQIAAVTQSVVPDAPAEAQQKAESERDWDTAGRIKADKLRSMMGR